MTFLLVGLGVMCAGGLGAVVARRWALAATWLGVGGCVSGCVLTFAPALGAVLGGGSESLYAPWQVPFGAFAVALDPLSGFFLLPIAGLSALAALYGSEYLKRGEAGASHSASWLWFNLLVASMVLLVVARNGILFLFAWEIMTITSFFLVTQEDTEPSAREAGWTYLIAMQLSAALLLAFFALLARGAPDLDFDRFGVAAGGASTAALFLLALVGFGTKAGFVPLHVWLPEAHPAAPSHVSAVMSGVMIKTGVYGLMRSLTFLGPPEPWWGWTLLGIGLASGIGGVAFALAQHDVKRMLAYHSVENIGIIAMGMGIGLLGQSAGAPMLSALGYGAALLHVLNHALFKGLLFLSAGAVARATGTRVIDELGGLLKTMPWTGAAFAVGAVAITGLPPLNGFVSEFLLFTAGLRDLASPHPVSALGSLALLGGLALIGGLAAACFTKAFGVIFLGRPRAATIALPLDPGFAMRAAFVVLSAGCVLIGLFGPAVVSVLAPVVGALANQSAASAQSALATASEPLIRVSWAGAALVGLIVALVLLRAWLLRGRNVAATVTWDCGFARPTPRMQYTGASFAQPLVRLFQPLLRTRLEGEHVAGFFPSQASLVSHTPDVGRAYAFEPIFLVIGRVLVPFRRLQHGNTHLYVLSIALALLVLLVWRLG